MKDVALPHVHVQENETFIWNQTRFLCATGWTDFSATGDNFRRLRPIDVIGRNHATHDRLAEELDKHFDGKTVVVTHHSPAPEVAGGKHDGHLIAAHTNRWHALVAKTDLYILGKCTVRLISRWMAVVWYRTLEVTQGSKQASIPAV